MKDKFSIGLLINDFVLPYWEYKVIKELISSDFAEIAVIIKHNKPASFTGKNGGGMSALLIKMLESSDRLIFKSKHDYYLGKSISSLLRDSPVIDLNSINGNQKRDFEQHVINTIKNLSLDIIIKFGVHDLEWNILEIPKFGTWAYSIDNHKGTESIDAGFREVVNYCPVTNSALEIIHNDQTQNEIIFNSWESTSPFSININRNKVYWRASLFIPRIIEGLYKYGDVYLDRLKVRFRYDNSGESTLDKAPSLLQTVKDELKFLIKVTGLTLKKLYYTDAFSWQLLIGVDEDSYGYSTDFKRFKSIPSPKELFWADPFIVALNDNYYVFVEEFIYDKDKAHISVLQIDDKGKLLKSERLIERPYHMSYPFIFTVNGIYYMIPETSSNRTIELYKCKDFPHNWEFERNIMENIRATDTTLFYYNSKWWMFTTIDQTADISGCSTELFLFFSDDVMNGKWESHPMNPVVSDSGNARMAGNLFVRDSQILRPSQDCSMRYGRGLNLNHVTKLTEEEYNEVNISRIKPDWDKKLKGIHTINFDHGLTVIDAYSYHKHLSFK